MIDPILVPLLDGDALTECVLPHVLVITSAFEARVILLHLLQRSHTGEGEDAIETGNWHLQKRESEVYLPEIAARLQDTNLDVKHVVLEGLPSERIVGFVNNSDLDLIALSTHG